MMLHPELLAFHGRLEAAGLVAARHADHLCVRLALLCSVRVRYDGERLTYEHRFGGVTRAVATASTFGIATAAVAGLALTGAALPVILTAGSLGVLAVVYDAMRYIVTEGAVTRATLLWQSFHSSGAAPTPALPGAVAPTASDMRSSPDPRLSANSMDARTPIGSAVREP
jgi:hypothetical protein